MTGYKSFVAAMFIVLMAGSPVLARADQRQPRPEHGISRHFLSSGQSDVERGSWCLHNYPSESVDCSFANQSECTHTASGGLGECVQNP
jgi:hypothetical protein